MCFLGFVNPCLVMQQGHSGAGLPQDGTVTLRGAHLPLPWGLWPPQSCCFSEWEGWNPTELGDLQEESKASPPP